MKIDDLDVRILELAPLCSVHEFLVSRSWNLYLTVDLKRRIWIDDKGRRILIAKIEKSTYKHPIFGDEWVTTIRFLNYKGKEDNGFFPFG